jgi:hypothetical protein
MADQDDYLGIRSMVRATVNALNPDKKLEIEAGRKIIGSALYETVERMETRVERKLDRITKRHTTETVDANGNVTVTVDQDAIDAAMAVDYEMLESYKRGLINLQNGG